MKVTPLREKNRTRSLKPIALGDDVDTLVKRARAYLATVEGAVAGNRGHDRCMRAAGVLTQKFGLSVEAALPVLAEWNETSCEPPFSEKELIHKLTDGVRLRSKRGLRPIE